MIGYIKIIIIFVVLFYTNIQLANETLIYADSVDYDSDQNIIAKGNAKLIKEDEVIISNLIIYNKKKQKYIIPNEFKFKDGLNNYYSGSKAEFSKNLNYGEIQDPKIHLSDGSRIVGKTLIRDGDIDIIKKATFTPCTSKIKIRKFICPIWEFEDEKLLHDNEKLFLYHKHAKLRVLNVPVAYMPYLVSPSPLRKKRKSGFLSPTIDLIFFDAQTSQSVHLPYYFALDIDKELYFTPIINYGGGVDSSQKFNFVYNQLISGGHLDLSINIDSQIENENNETWFKDASISGNYYQKLNEKYEVSFTTSFQSSPTYLRKTDLSNLLNQESSLSTSLNLNGYNLRKMDDHLNAQITSYQVVKRDDDNGTTPTALPYIKYNAGESYYKNINYQNKYSFYNIVRDKSSGALAQRQQKINYNLTTDYETYKIYSKINFRSEFLTHLYHIDRKEITEDNYFTGNYARVFPMTGAYLESPIRNKKYNYIIKPQLSLILNSMQPSSNKVSNEESSSASYSLVNHSDLNRYKGSDKLDNSQRINYGIDLTKGNFKAAATQSYEFNKHSNYNKAVGLKDSLSDILMTIKYEGTKNTIRYANRINVDIGEIANQAITYQNSNKIIDTMATYSIVRTESNDVFNSGSETFDISLSSKKFIKYNTVSLDANYDLIKEYATKYTFAYRYLDECFGVNIDFVRSGFEDRDLKPKDTLTIQFSFKYVGGYSSTNLAVSEQEKNNIDFIFNETDNSQFIAIDNEG